MLIDWLDSEIWYELNDTLSRKLNRPETEELKVFSGLGLGLIETLMGLTRLFPHRKTLALDRKQSPFFESIAIEASKQGLKVQDLSNIEDEALETFFKESKKDLLLTLCSSGDPCTSELFPRSETYKKLSFDHRVFFIQTHHHWEQSLNSFEVGPREVHLFSSNPKSCIALMGKKVQIKDFLHPIIDWSQNDLSHWIAFLSSCIQDKQKVELFENRFPDYLFLENSTPRFYDRALISFENIDGSFFVSEFKLKHPNSNIETSSLCQWKSPKLWESLLKRGFSEEKLRGLLVIPLSDITENLPREVEEVRLHCLGRQGFTDSTLS